MPKSSKKHKDGSVPVSKAPAVPRTVSVRGQARNAEQMVAGLAGDLQQIVKDINAQFNAFAAQLAGIRHVLGAAIDAAGVTAQVEAKVKADLAADAEKKATQAKQALEKLIEQRIAVPSGVVGEDSIVVGHNTEAGEQIPGRIQMPLSSFPDEIKAGIIGKEVGGTVITGPRTFTVDEIYVIDAERMAAVQQEEQEKAAKQAADNAIAAAKAPEEPPAATIS